MSETSVTESATASGHHKSTPPWKSPLNIAIAALVVAVVAVAVAIAAWIYPGSSKSYSGAQSSQAKTKICTAWAPVRKSVWVGTPNPLPGDPVAQLAVAANVRLAMLGGGSYLRELVAAEPATPADLAKAVNSVADTLQRMGENYLAMSPSNVLESLHRDLDKQGAEIGKLCK